MESELLEFFNFLKEVFEDFQIIKVNENDGELTIDVNDNEEKNYDVSTKYLNPVKCMVNFGIYLLKEVGQTYHTIIINYSSNFTYKLKLKNDNYDLFIN